MRTRFLVLAALAPGLTVIPAQADPVTRVQGLLGLDAAGELEFDPEEYAERNEFAPYSPADSDLGVQEILRPTPRRAPVRLDITNEFLWTDNAPSPTRATDDQSTLWIGRAAAAWRPRLVGPLFADLGLVEEVLRFDDSAAIDFENLDTRAGVFASLPDLDDLLVFGRYEYQRLTSGSLSDGDYLAQRIRIGAQKVLWADARQQFGAGLDAAFDVETKPAVLERDEYALDLNYTYQLAPALVGRVFCRTGYFNYAGAGRHDWAWNPGIDLIWTCCDYGRMYVSLYFSENDSNTPGGVNDYESWTTGLGIGANFQF
jgi:hypothetical protein